MSAEATAIDLLDVTLFAERREHEAFAILRRDAPVYFNPEPAGPGFYAVTRHRDVLEIVRDAARLSSARGTQIADVRAEGAGFPITPSTRPGVPEMLTSARPEYIEAVFAQIEESYGDVDSYLARALDIDAAARARLTGLLTEPASEAS